MKDFPLQDFFFDGEYFTFLRRGLVILLVLPVVFFPLKLEGFLLRDCSGIAGTGIPNCRDGARYNGWMVSYGRYKTQQQLGCDYRSEPLTDQRKESKNGKDNGKDRHSTIDNILLGISHC